MSRISDHSARERDARVTIVGAVLILLLSAALAPAQQSSPDQDASNFAPRGSVAGPMVVREPLPPSVAFQRANGSLFKATLAAHATEPGPVKLANASFFAVSEPTAKTVKKHDFITIIVRQQSEMTAEGKLETTKDSNVDMQLQQWIKLNAKNFAIRGGAQGLTPPGVQWDLSRNMTADAKADRSDSLTLRVTAEVIDVKPNGTLIVEGKSFVKHDDEEISVTLSGVANVKDIAPDNTILSTQLGDLRLITDHKGAIRDATQRGIIPKLLDALNPF